MFYVLAILVAACSLAAGVAIIAIPFAILAWISKSTDFTPQTKSMKDEMVKAQWEFDRIFKRRKP